MCRTPLTAHRSKAFTIKKGGDRAGRRKERMLKEAGLLVAKGVRVPSRLEDLEELSGTSGTSVEKIGGKVRIGWKHNLSTPIANTQESGA